jgi:hypothetical protein
VRRQTVPAAEVAQHRLDTYARPGADMLKRGLDGNLLPCQIEAGLQNPFPGRSRGFCPLGVVVGTFEFMSLAVDTNLIFVS